MIDYDALASQFDGAVDTTVHTKAFVGIISQGTLGASQDFTPTEGSLIENLDQLRAVAHANGAGLFASLPGRLRYTIHFSNTYANPSGLVETATTQQVVTGYSTKGVPKYKTVRNKFAIMTVFLMGDQGQKHKIKDINLGPVDAAAVNPSPIELGNLVTSIQANLVSSDTADFHSLVSPTPTNVINVAPTVQSAPTVEQQATASAMVAALPFGVLPPDQQAKNDALAVANLAKDLAGRNMVVSTNYAEALQNLVPVKLVYNGPGRVGFPAQLLASADQNVPAGFREVDLATAQAIIHATPSDYIVGDVDEVNKLYTKLKINNDTQGDFYSKVLVVGGIGLVGIAPNQILSGNLPASTNVWAYRDNNGHLLTNVPLADIRAGKFN